MAERVAHVRERIGVAAQRAGRDAGGVLLIAVTKGVDAARIDQALAAGITDIGENRVQEAMAKRGLVTGVARHHMIGHLQTNKASGAASLFDVVHSVDSERVALALSAHRPAAGEPLGVLVEVDLTDLPGRAGVGEGDVESLVRVITGLPGLRLIGLMTVAAPVAEEARQAFARLRTLRDRVEHATGHPLPELSMGMSADFEAAVAEGATMVRVGRAIFAEATVGG